MQPHPDLEPNLGIPWDPLGDQTLIAHKPHHCKKKSHIEDPACQRHRSLTPRGARGAKRANKRGSMFLDPDMQRPLIYSRLVDQFKAMQRRIGIPDSRLNVLHNALAALSADAKIVCHDDTACLALHEHAVQKRQGQE